MSINDDLLRDIGVEVLRTGAGVIGDKPKAEALLASEPIQRYVAAQVAEVQTEVELRGSRIRHVERERDEARTEVERLRGVLEHAGVDLPDDGYHVEVEGVRFTQPQWEAVKRLRAAAPADLPDVGIVRRAPDRQMWIGEYMWDDDTSREARKRDLAERIAADRFLDGEQTATATDDEVEGYCVCDGPLSPARDCGIRAHRTAAARARQTGEA